MQNKRKYLLAAFFILTPIFLSACGAGKTVDMNELSSDNRYHYRNDSLGFSVNLPKDFIYYQTQRNNKTDYTELEFYVPTSDRRYSQEVSGYARPVSIRVYKKDSFNNWPAKDERKFGFTVIKEKDEKVYAVKFWDKAPTDWQNKWNEMMRQDILDNINI
jgi:hypothetical protein